MLILTQKGFVYFLFKQYIKSIAKKEKKKKTLQIR